LNLLVTGAAGFIGSRVTEFLLQRGDWVVGVDNMNDYYDPALKEWRIAGLQKYRNLIFFREDISSPEAMDRIFNGRSFDGVINLAARAGVRASLLNPWIYYEANVTGTLNLLEACRRHGVNKFVLASTSSLYGSENLRPFREDANTDRSLSPYAASKKAAETLCYTYHRLYGIDMTVFRYFTVYGPAGRPDMSPFRFVRWVSEGSPVTIYGDGLQQRDFTYVDDVARGTLTGLAPMGFEVINLGSDRPVALIETLNLAARLVGREPVIEHRDRNVSDVFATWADITKAGKLLGWRPEVSLEEGFGRLVDWYKANADWLRKMKDSRD
jgi:UDP-glucuronate 4-epimerase